MIVIVNATRIPPGPATCHGSGARGHGDGDGGGGGGSASVRGMWERKNGKTILKMDQGLGQGARGVHGKCLF